jgi:hypothetical protein
MLDNELVGLSGLCVGFLKSLVENPDRTANYQPAKWLECVHGLGEEQMGRDPSSLAHRKQNLYLK